MELNFVDKKAKLNVSDEVFGTAYNEPLVHQIVTACLNNIRTGNSAQKTRSEVRGGGAKPWRQKGTGRARAGTIRSPIWRTGGVTFAAKPRSYAQKVNRKMYSKAMRSILSELNRQQRLIVVNDDFINVELKTKAMVAKLKALDLSNVLLVSHELADNIYLATRNIPNVDVTDAAGVDPLGLLAYEKVLMTESAIKYFEERLA